MKEKYSIANQSLQRRIWKELPFVVKQKYFKEYQVDLDEYRRGPRATRRSRVTEPSSTLTWVNENPMEDTEIISMQLNPSSSPYKTILPNLNTTATLTNQPIQQMIYPINNESYKQDIIPTVENQYVEWESLFFPLIDFDQCTNAFQ
jgi:hypothetical protein